MAPILKYAKDDYVLYDRSDDVRVWQYDNAITVPNIGSDIYDKFTYIIDHYDNLPDVACYTKANLFKYITEEEFKKVKDNKTFTPLLTKNHEEKFGVSFYSPDGMYNEINNRWFLGPHPCKHLGRADELFALLNLNDKEYLKFAPGSNYIVPKENILKHPKEFYIKLHSYLDWAVYPGEAQIMERALYYLWK